MKPIITAILFLFCSSVIAKTYYVDHANTLANDANAGTATAPWKTIQKGANTVVAGDTVLVKSGTYAERISFSSGHSGSAGKKIVFRSTPRRTVNMQGFNTTGCNYLRVEGFNVTHNVGGWLGGGIWMSSSNLEIVDNYLHDIPGPGIQSNWGGSMDTVYIGSNHVYHCQYGITVTGKNFLVEGNEVDRLYQYDTGGDCDYSRFFGDNITYKDNYFHGTIFSEIGSAHLDCWQTFDNNGEHARNITWDGNWCSECHEGVMAEGIYYRNVGDFTFKNNVFAHSGAWGLCISNGVTNINVFNNTFYDIKYFGVGFGGAYTSGAVVKNNIFVKCGDQAILVNNGAAPATEDYNLFYLSPQNTVATNDKMNINPLFADTAANNFSLKAGSPAIDAGTALTGVVTTDKAGVTRPQGAGWDMGAYEYTTTGVIFFPLQQPGSKGKTPIFSNVQNWPWEKAVPVAVYDLSGKSITANSIHRSGVYFVKAGDNRNLGKLVIAR